MKRYREKKDAFSFIQQSFMEKNFWQRILTVANGLVSFYVSQVIAVVVVIFWMFISQNYPLMYLYYICIACVKLCKWGYQLSKYLSFHFSTHPDMDYLITTKKNKRNAKKNSFIYESKNLHWTCPVYTFPSKIRKNHIL